MGEHERALASAVRAVWDPLTAASGFARLLEARAERDAPLLEESLLRVIDGLVDAIDALERSVLPVLLLGGPGETRDGGALRGLDVGELVVRAARDLRRLRRHAEVTLERPDDLPTLDVNDLVLRCLLTAALDALPADVDAFRLRLSLDDATLRISASADAPRNVPHEGASPDLALAGYLATLLSATIRWVEDERAVLIALPLEGAQAA